MGGPPKCVTELRERLYLPKPGGVYDRWSAISEQVYGTALRVKPLVCDVEFQCAIRKIQPVVIYCRPPEKVMERNMRAQVEKAHKDKQHVSAIIEHRETIRKLYDELMAELPMLGCVVLHYDYTKNGGFIQNENRH